MATRPVFVPDPNPPYSREYLITFTWFAGFAKAQAQRSITDLHRCAALEGIASVLEISSKSLTVLGVQLSAFNLLLKLPNGSSASVESIYQGSKIFEQGGPFVDLYRASSREAKSDPRIRESGAIVGFDFFGQSWPTQPTTAFYDWLYLSALEQSSQEVHQKLLEYAGFSDIAFNAQKSAACQTRSAALFVALTRAGLLQKALSIQAGFLEVVGNLP
jgi:hypothetical protein